MKHNVIGLLILFGLTLQVSCIGGKSSGGNSSNPSSDIIDDSGDDTNDETDQTFHETLPSPWTKIIGDEVFNSFLVDIVTDSDNNIYTLRKLAMTYYLQKMDNESNLITTMLEVQNFPDNYFGNIKIQVSNDGYVYVLGNIANTQDTGFNIFLGKYDLNTGSEVWTHNYGGDSDFKGYDFIVQDDAIYILGTQPTPPPGHGNTISFLGKLNLSSGTVSSSFDSISVIDSSAHIYPSSLTINSSGQYLYASFPYSASGVSVSWIYDGGQELAFPNLIGSTDVVVTKFDLSLNPVWIKSYGVSTKDYDLSRDQSISVDTNGNVYLVGKTNDLTSAAGGFSGTERLFIVKFNDNEADTSAEVFYKDIALTAESQIALSSDDNIYVSGTILTGSLQDEHPLERNASDGYLLKLNSSLIEDWYKAVQNGNTKYLEVMGLNIANNGMIIIGGSTDHDLYSSTMVNTTNSRTDTFITTLQPDGTSDQ